MWLYSSVMFVNLHLGKEIALPAEPEILKDAHLHSQTDCFFSFHLKSLKCDLSHIPIRFTRVSLVHTTLVDISTKTKAHEKPLSEPTRLYGWCCVGPLN